MIRPSTASAPVHRSRSRLRPEPRHRPMSWHIRPNRSGMRTPGLLLSHRYPASADLAPEPATEVLFFAAETSPVCPCATIDQTALLNVIHQVGVGRTILACPRVGGVQHVMPDWRTGDCGLDGCGKAVWVSERIAGRMGRRERQGQRGQRGQREADGGVVLVCRDHLESQGRETI